MKDVDDVKFVINYDFPSNSEDYVHRIGRTGRSNNKGTSYTFFTPSNAGRVDELVNILNETNQYVNPELYQLKKFSYKGNNRRYGQKSGGYGNKSGGYGGGGYGKPNGGNFGRSNNYENGGGYKKNFEGYNEGAGHSRFSDRKDNTSTNGRFGERSGGFSNGSGSGAGPRFQ